MHNPPHFKRERNPLACIFLVCLLFLLALPANAKTYVVTGGSYSFTYETSPTNSEKTVYFYGFICCAISPVSI